MFTNNFYKMLKGLFSGSRTYDSTQTLIDYDGVSRSDVRILESTTNSMTVTFLPFQTTNYSSNNGSIYGLSNNTNIYNGTTYTSSYGNKSGVIIGDGNTTPTANDYCLSGNIITDFTASTTLQVTVDANKLLAVATYNITNTGASDFTIREIGATRAMRFENTSTYYRYLFERSLLATPVTIAPGDTGVVTYKIEIS